MAVVTIDVFSKAMGRQVTLQALIPLEAMKEGDTLRSLYLLHGVNGSYSNWMSVTNIFRAWSTHNMACARKGQKRLAIFMPSAGNGFYHAVPHKGDPAWQEPYGHKHDYEAFFAEDLIKITREMFPLSKEREDTMIAGLSMGGYGALLTAFHYPKTFGRCGGLSSALVTRKTEEQLKESGFYGQKAFLDVLFGDFDAVRNQPQHDVYQALLALADAKNEADGAAKGIAPDDPAIPAIYLACGTEDALLPLSRELHASLEEKGIPHRYEEHEGGHEWAFWEWGLGRMLDAWEEDLS